MKRKIKLQPHEDFLLRQLYLAFRVPSDQWAQRPEVFARFVNEWNLLSGRNDPGEDIRHYIITKRKARQWVTFNGDYDPLRCPGDHSLSSDEWSILEKTWIALNVGREQMAFDTSLRDTLVEQFAAESGRIVSGELLYAAVMAKQKRGEWVRITPPPTRDRGMGFSDIDEAI